MGYCLQATDLCKRFLSEWIFYGFTEQFVTGERVAIQGHNGSGKSTLLQVLAQSTEPSSGQIQLSHHEKPIAYNPALHLSYAAPYLELIEEFTALEMVQFHFQFKPLMAGITHQQLLAEVQLSQAAHKQIRLYSSGMKQRLKLALAFMAHTPLLFLDEPCTNLDSDGYALYHRLMLQYSPGRLLLLASNDAAEMQHCNRHIQLSQYKP